jgi:hypothetical protein
VEELRLHYRQAGDATFTAVVMNIDATGTATARIALAQDRGGYDLEYHVEALAPSLTPLAAVGSETEPLVIRVPEAPPRRSPVVSAFVDDGRQDLDDEESSGGGVLSEWWFWTVVGVVVAGGVSAYVLFGPPSQDGLPDATLGSLPVE